jgi:mRNA-decapping enzyme subunit 2
MPKQPPQKLTNHAMNLLNTFKSPSAPAAQPVQQPVQEMPAQLTPQVDQSEPILPSQLLGGAHNMPDRQPSPPQIHQPQAQRSRNAHQDSLLNLFKSAATPVAPQSQSLPPPAAEPVELAAQPSPHMAREMAREMMKPVQHKLSMRRLPNVNTAVSSQKASPHLTSATVSGPLNAPDFETVQKNMPQRPVELGNGIASPSPSTVPQTSFHPATIMQRPGGGALRQATATPPVPVHTVTNTTTMEAPRPFQPSSILRRSAQDIADMAQQGQTAKQVVPTQAQPPVQEAPQPVPQQQRTHMPNFDRRDSGRQEHKNTLLSLFGGGPPAPTKLDGPPLRHSPAEFPGSLPLSAIPPGHGRASGIGSPVSPLPSINAIKRQERTATAGDPYAHQQDTPRSSRISSLNSARGETPILQTLPSIVPTGYIGAPSQQAPKSKPTPPIKRASTMSDAGGSGAQSPITPVEKSFLLGYLQGVVTKENERRAAGGGRQGGGLAR